jgi:hypothetical protein
LERRMTKASADTTAISSHEAAQVERANDSGRIPVVFVHGLWPSYERQRHNEGVTEIVKLEGRGHALTIDHGWQAVAEIALNFVSRFQPTTGGN